MSIKREQIPFAYLEMYDKYSRVFTEDEHPIYFMLNKLNQSYLQNLEACILEKQKAENGDVIDKIIYIVDFMMPGRDGSSELHTRTYLAPFYDEMLRWLMNNPDRFVYQQNDCLQFLTFRIENEKVQHKIYENRKWCCKIKGNSNPSINCELPIGNYTEFESIMEDWLRKIPEVNYVSLFELSTFKDWTGTDGNYFAWFNHSIMLSGCKLNKHEIEYIKQNQNERGN